MTRSQGPNDQTPPQWRQTTHAAQPQGANDQQQAHWQPQQQQQPPGYEADPYLPQGGQAAQYHQPQDPAANYPPGGEHAYPSAYDHYAQQGNYGAAQPQPQYPDPTYAQPGYELPAQQPSYPDQYAQQGYGDPQYAQPAQDYGQQPAQDYPSDDYWSAAPGGLGNPAPQAPMRQAPDNQAYDLGNYMPSGGDNRANFGDPGYQPLQNWDVGNNNYGDRGQPADRGYDQGGYPGGMPSRFEGAVAHHSDTYGHEHDEDFEYDDEDDEPGGGRKVVIAAALVAAIVVGGGFAYGYNALFGGSQGGNGTPIVKAESSPAKVQASDPGGRQFEHKDSKVLGKLSGDGQNSTAYSTSEGQTNGRVRSVSTLVVGRDGRLIVPDNAQSDNANSNAQPAPSSPPAGTITSTSPVPGLTIVGVNPPAAASEAPQSAPSTPPSSPPQALGAREVQPSNEVAPQPAAEAQPAAPAQTVTAAVTPQAQPQPQPKPAAATRSRRRSKYPPLPVRSSARSGGQAVAAAAPAQAAAPTPGVAQARVTPVVPQQKQQSQQQAAAPATTASVPAAAAGNGYVAVLSTKRSRIDALTSFADLQQKYGNILGTKVPAVRRADLSARGLGIMYRAVVGPPGSRQAAAQVCTQLKSAGYSGCWVAPY